MKKHHLYSSCALTRGPKGFVFVGAFCVLLAVLTEHAGADSLPGWRGGDDDGGQQKEFLAPVSVVSTAGNVDGAATLVSGGKGATLTMVPGGPAPVIILDYGRDVGGLPVFEVSALSGTPRLEAIYSEAQQWLSPTGDASYPDGAQVNVSFVGNCGAASLSRVVGHSPSSPGLIVDRLIQGGERFQLLTLTAPGSITLRRVGVLSTFFMPRSTANRGSFRSSDPALNEIWGLGAYTLQLDQVPAGSLPSNWISTSQGVDVKGSTYSVYQTGTAWTNYTASVDVQVVIQAIGSDK